MQTFWVFGDGDTSPLREHNGNGSSSNSLHGQISPREIIFDKPAEIGRASSPIRTDPEIAGSSYGRARKSGSTHSRDRESNSDGSHASEINHQNQSSKYEASSSALRLPVPATHEHGIRGGAAGSSTALQLVSSKLARAAPRSPLDGGVEKPKSSH